MAEAARLPVWPTVRRAYGLLWDHRRLHAKAIWPPIVFLAAAEFLFHKVVGDAHSVNDIEQALSGASWYWLAAIAVLWLVGLKFLLSFSISWRRHILLGEKFDPLFFKKPFWSYLACVLIFDLILGPFVVYPFFFLLYLLFMSRLDGTASSYFCLMLEVLVLIYLLRIVAFISETVPKFSAICVSDEKLTWPLSWRIMTAMSCATSRSGC